MEHVARVVVPGNPCVGAVHFNSVSRDGAGILLTRVLQLSDYTLATRSIGIICEVCEPSSHIAVVCRILGIPILALDNAAQLFSDGQIVTLDPSAGRVQGEPFPLASHLPLTDVVPSVTTLGEFPLSYQLSIVDIPDLISRANALQRGDIQQFFLRSEFIWVAEGIHPFSFLSTHGSAAAADLLVGHLVPLLDRIDHGQFLNFRSLDIRSDQWHQFGDARTVEPNPQLGLHGIRQLLVHEAYLIAEMLAVDRLLERGFSNLIYSLSFLTLESELDFVQELASRTCRNRLPLGIFLETPAAVLELPYLLKHHPAAIYVGTKDLSQLILAADRDNHAVAHLLDVTSRPVLTTLSGILAECTRHDTPVFVFTFIDSLTRLLAALPELSRVSLTTADYLRAYRK